MYRIGKDRRHTPLLGFTFAFFSIASITLPSSSATSLTQSVFPVATKTCVLHSLTCPYNLSSSSTLKPFGYLIWQELQSCSQSSPSTAGSTFGNKDSQGVMGPLTANLALPRKFLSIEVMVACLPACCLFTKFELSRISRRAASAAAVEGRVPTFIGRKNAACWKAVERRG